MRYLTSFFGGPTAVSFGGIGGVRRCRPQTGASTGSSAANLLPRLLPLRARDFPAPKVKPASPSTQNSIGAAAALDSQSKKPLRSFAAAGAGWQDVAESRGVKEKVCGKGNKSTRQGHLENRAGATFDEAVGLDFWKAVTTRTPTRSLANCSTGWWIPCTATNCRHFGREMVFREAPAVPAAIDEVADMTFPVDPKPEKRERKKRPKIFRTIYR